MGEKGVLDYPFYLFEAEKILGGKHCFNSFFENPEKKVHVTICMTVGKQKWKKF